MAVNSLPIPAVRSPSSLLDAVARSFAVICLLSVITVVFRAFDAPDTPFLAFSVIGAIAVHWLRKPKIAEIALTLALAGFSAIVYLRTNGRLGVFVGSHVIATAAFLGLASIFVLGWRACRATENLADLLSATFCPVLMIFTNVALALAIRIAPNTYDPYLYRFDGLLGLQASFLVGQWFIRFPILYSACFLVYAALPLAEVLVFLFYLRGYRMPVNPLVLFTVAGLCGFLLYQICPATGPAHVFSSFPGIAPRPMPLLPISIPDIPRNAIPSLHSAWAFLMWWNVRRCPAWLRCIAGSFLVFTLLATLGLGEHYLIDLIVAVPFALAVDAVCAKHWSRAVTAFALTIGWLLYLRFGLAIWVPSLAQSWLAVAGTALTCAFLADERVPGHSAPEPIA